MYISAAVVSAASRQTIGSQLPRLQHILSRSSASTFSLPLTSSSVSHPHLVMHREEDTNVMSESFEGRKRRKGFIYHRRPLFPSCRPYNGEYTGSHPISEVKLHLACLVLPWVTRRESWVLTTFFFLSSSSFLLDLGSILLFPCSTECEAYSCSPTPYRDSALSNNIATSSFSSLPPSTMALLLFSALVSHHGV